MDLIKMMRDFCRGIVEGIFRWENGNDVPDIKWGQSSEDDCCNKKCGCDESKDYPYNTELSEHPNKKWTKKKLKEFMDTHNIKYNSRDTKNDLLQKIEWSKK